jgi:glycosyltransferase involved in cell wall biosynthesis
MTGPAGQRLRIALVTHVRHPVARPFMGGMEAHAWHLARALDARGHEVTLFASGDSDAPGRLQAIVPRHYDADLPWHAWRGTERLNALLDSAFAAILAPLRDGGFDIVHNNSLHRYPPRMARRDGVPMLTSLHVPPFDALHRAVLAAPAPWARFTVCSQAQTARWWPDGAPDVAHVVPNGIDLADWPFRPRGDGSAVWSGRLTPTKGAEIAVEAARRAGLPLTLFGTIEHRDYFEARIRPHLGGDIRYGGHLSQADLAREIGRASVFLFTPLWDEPFGLVAAEAMACGVPVAALPNGAVPEVVRGGGAVASDVSAAALSAAIREALAIQRATVRAEAERRFGIERMVGDYEALYARAIAARPARTPPDPGFAEIELPGAAQALAQAGAA